MDRKRESLKREAPSHGVTERQLSEERLREQHFRVLCTKMPAICHSIDRSGRIIAVSDDWLDKFGYDRSEVVGKKSLEFLTPTSRGYVEALALPDFWSTGSARNVSVQVVRKNGEIVDVLLSAIAERDGDGKYCRGLAILRDLSEHRSVVEEQTGKVERETIRRNPYKLTIRELSVLDLMAAGKADKEIAAELGIRSLTASKHVSNILGKMNSKSRTEAGTRALREGLLD